MRIVPVIAICFSLLAVHPAAVAPAAPSVQRFHGEYSVSYLGFKVGESTINTTLKGDQIIARATASSAGLVSLFDETKATVVVRANVGKTEIVPEVFRLDYTSGKKKQMTQIRFRRGDAIRTVNKPALRKRDKKTWVPLGKADLAKVFDPFTAALIKAPSLEAVCDRTLRAYDGEMRADFVLAHKGFGELSIDGYSGRTVTCSVKYKPVAGYRKDRKELISLRDRADIEVAFAPLGRTGLYVPVHATAKTDVGTVTLRARRSVLTN
jgi:hypothetical protein